MYFDGSVLLGLFWLAAWSIAATYLLLFLFAAGAHLTPALTRRGLKSVVVPALGATLAPLASLLGGFMQPPGAQSNNLSSLGNLKPNLIAAYGEPDRITVASSSGFMGLSLDSLLGIGQGNFVVLSHLFGNHLGARPGTD